MPSRYILIPPPVFPQDPDTGQPRLPAWDFAFVMQRLMSNPLWTESFAAMRSQAVIHDAWLNVRDNVMTLAEEDWLLLRQSVEVPKMVMTTDTGGQLITGLGVHPMLARYLVPLLAAIMDATTERPRTKNHVEEPARQTTDSPA